ncbi:ryanodine-sensitive calcium-release channel [Aureococcus anophagefferens]|nr:ryanodine-sensitive calcium-release channel [Aureococcus anophagefferens]
MAGAGAQQQPLRCGDQVYLEISRGEATCRVHADVLKLGVTLNAGGDAGDFELDGRFAVYPAGRFAAQAEARARSRSTRRREARGDEERRLGAGPRGAAPTSGVGAAAGRDRAPLRYGDAVQLRHVATGCWLEERGAGDDGAGQRGGDAAARAPRPRRRRGARATRAAPTRSRSARVAAQGRTLRALRREFVAHGAAARGAAARSERAERSLGACIAWLGRDAGDAAGPGAAAPRGPDRGRQALAREMGLVAALADVVRARDREAGPSAGPNSNLQPDFNLCFAGNKANEFFFVEQEGGGWFLACIDQIAYSVGAAEALSQLVSDNEELLERHIDARVVDDFASLIEAQGPRADLLGFLGAICSCRGRGVKSNQELCAARLGLVDAPGAGGREARRSAARSCCGSARAATAAPAGAARGVGRDRGRAGGVPRRRGAPRGLLRASSWTCPADGGAWEPRTSHLFWGPGRAGVRRAGGKVVLGLAVVSDGRGGAWVELGDLLWILEEDDAARDALCRDVVGCPYDEVYAAARGDEALRAGLARQKQLARYFVEQVRTLSEMVRTRSYKVARVVEKEWSYGLLVSSMVDARLPAAARAALVRLLHHLYLDRYPHEENCGKAQLPEQIVVVDPTSALYPQSDPALKDADATLRKSGYVDRRDSLNDDADFVAAERRAARRIRDRRVPDVHMIAYFDAVDAAAGRGGGKVHPGGDADRRRGSPGLERIQHWADDVFLEFRAAVDELFVRLGVLTNVANVTRGDILRGLGQRRTLADDGDTAGAAGAAAPPPSPRAVEDVRRRRDPSRRRPPLIRKFLEPEKQYELEDVLVDLMLTESDALAAATFRLAQRVRAQRAAAPVRALLLAEPELGDLPPGWAGSFATYPQLDDRVSDLRHYVQSYQVWTNGPGPGPLRDAEALREILASRVPEDTPVLERAARDLAVVAAAAATRPALVVAAAGAAAGAAVAALPELDAPRSPRRDDDALRDYLDGGGADRREATARPHAPPLAAREHGDRCAVRCALGKRPAAWLRRLAVFADDSDDDDDDLTCDAVRALVPADVAVERCRRCRRLARSGTRDVGAGLCCAYAVLLLEILQAARVDAAGDLLRAYGACAAELALVDDDGAQPAGDGGVEDLVTLGEATTLLWDAVDGAGAAARATGRRGAARDYSLLADDAAAAVDAAAAARRRAAGGLRGSWSRPGGGSWARPGGLAGARQTTAALRRTSRLQSAVRHSGAVHAQDEERLMAARLHTLTETGEDCFLTSLRVRRGGAVAAAVAERLVRFCGANMHDPRHEATVLDAMETLATFLRFHAANHAASQLPADHGLTLSSPETLQPAACEVFDMIDTDGSGAITFEEIMDALQSNPYVFNFMNECGDERLASFCDPRTLASAFASIDGDGSNTISKKEWEAVVAEGVVGAGSPLARRAKRAWDASEAPKAQCVLSRVARLLEAVNPRVVLVRRNVARTRLEAEQRALAAAGGVDVAYGMVAAPQLDDRLRVGALGLSALLLFGGVEATRRRYLENLRGTDPEGYFFQYTAVDLLLGTVSDRGELMGAMASQEGLNRRSFDLFAAAARLLDALVAGDAAGDLPARELAPAAVFDLHRVVDLVVAVLDAAAHATRSRARAGPARRRARRGVDARRLRRAARRRRRRLAAARGASTTAAPEPPPSPRPGAGESYRGDAAAGGGLFRCVDAEGFAAEPSAPRRGPGSGATTTSPSPSRAAS